MKKRASRKLEDKTIPQLKRKLDEVMSKWVRWNYARQSLGGELLQCFTCDKFLPVKSAHSGHYIPRHISPTRYDERNQRPQCPSCNTFGAGMPHEFRRRLCDEIGGDAVRELEDKAREPWKWDRFWLIDKIREYQAELKGME